MILESPAKNTRAIRRRDVFLPTVQRSARVRFSQEQMFDLVNDVKSYPQFLHWCRGARIESQQGNVVEASLDIGLMGVHQSFRTRNTLTRPERIQLELVSGPFRRLRGEWRFRQAPTRGTDVSLSLAFEVTLSPFGIVFSKIFEELAGSQMNAFIARAEQMYAEIT
jgi:ribosome-associated toxin RatA of RatAB toxin-antitoxin module